MKQIYGLYDVIYVIYALNYVFFRKHFGARCILAL